MRRPWAEQERGAGETGEPRLSPQVDEAEAGRPGGRRREFFSRGLFIRLALTALVLTVLGGLAYLTVSADGFIRRAELAREKSKLEAENAALRDENQLLRRKIERLLNDPGFVEDEARRKLGLIRPGETVYRLSEEPDLTE
ncbi:MAG: septum formation initiator family protein [Candidatus Adiutrix sp.]|jgi:cell division protein FtsB|nr:septum formation initiator family protein [Candidatus Adiutrix sp.]